MKHFIDYLNEHIVNIGFKGDDNELRNKHSDEIHQMLHKAYSQLPDGYRGLGSGTKEEHDSIQSDIHNPEHIIKMHRRGDKITHVSLYKKTKYGRKLFATASDGSLQGKKDYVQNSKEDNRMKDRHSYAEVSGKPEAIARKMGTPVVPNHKAKEILGKEVELHPDGEYYTRSLGGTPHKKVMIGHTKT